MKTVIRSLIPLLLLTISTVPATRAQDQKTDVVPAFIPLQTFDVSPVKLPEVMLKTLKNGMTVYYIPDHEVPVVSLRMTFLAGSLFNPADKAGLNNFMADMLLKGTTTRSAQDIAEAIDFVGGSISSGAGDNTAFMTSSVLARDLELAMELMSDALRNPTFPDDEIERLRTQRVSDLMTNLDNPGTIASEQWNKWVYGDHPYGQPSSGTIETVKAFSRDDIAAQHDELIVPANALLIITGDFEVKHAESLVRSRFADWKGPKAPEISVTDPQPGMGREILLIDKPDAVQSQIRMGYVLGRYNLGDDTYAFRLMDYTYGGGGFSSRLMKRIRTELGLTYGISSELAARQQNGSYTISGSTKNESSGEFIGETLHLMQAVIDSGFTEQELNDAKAYMLGSYPRGFETPAQVASQFQSAILFDFGDPADYIANYRKRMASVQLSDINAMAMKYLHPDLVRIVVVGNAESVKPQLEPFGHVTVKSIDEFKTEM